MKYKEIFLIYLLIITSLLYPFSNIYSQVSGYGIKAGINSSNIKIIADGDSIKNIKGKSATTPTFGIVAYGMIYNNIGLITEVNLYSFIGTNYTDTIIKEDNSTFPVTITKEEKEDKLRIFAPNYTMMLSYHFNESFFTMAGFSLDATIRKYYKGGESDYDEHTYAMKYIMDSRYDKVIKGNICFGGGYTYRKIRLAARYSIGLGNLYTHEIITGTPLEKAKYNSIQCSFSVIIPGMKIGNSIKRKY